MNDEMNDENFENHPDEIGEEHNEDFHNDSSDPTSPTNPRRRLLIMAIKRFNQKWGSLLDNRLNHLWAQWRRDPQKVDFTRLFDELWVITDGEKLYHDIIDFEVALFQEYNRWLASKQATK